MKNKIIYIAVLVCLAISWVHAEKKENLRVAFTIDDLPFVLAGKPNGDHTAIRKEKTVQLIKKLRSHNIPAVGFVVSGRLTKKGKGDKADKANVELINMWMDAALELGNHSYSHPSLHNVPVDEYIENIKKGHQHLIPAMAKKGKTPRYFRHPMLHTGRTMEIKKKVGMVLKKKGYTIAPVTIDNSDWLFALAYNRAGAKGDKALQKKIEDSYIPYMEKKFEYYENQSRDLLGYQVNHILLLHANILNAEHIDRLIVMLKKRGYTFITLQEALKDKAYRLGDQFTGRAGISWIHRWAIAKGKKGAFFKGEPETPDFVKEAAKKFSE